MPLLTVSPLYLYDWMFAYETNLKKIRSDCGFRESGIELFLVQVTSEPRCLIMFNHRDD